MTNNMDGVCASKKSWLWLAYMSQSNGYGGIEMVKLGRCRLTKEEAEQDCAYYVARCNGRGEGPSANWVEQVPARYSWHD